MDARRLSANTHNKILFLDRWRHHNLRFECTTRAAPDPKSDYKTSETKTRKIYLALPPPYRWSHLHKEILHYKKKRKFSRRNKHNSDSLKREKIESYELRDRIQPEWRIYFTTTERKK